MVWYSSVFKCSSKTCLKRLIPEKRSKLKERILCHGGKREVKITHRYGFEK